MNRTILSAVSAALLVACTAASPRNPAGGPACPPHKLVTEHLPNAIQVHPDVISGGVPDGDGAFAELRRLGVRTVISVDGAAPDIELARKHGLRYVHLPHGYAGVPPQRGKELAKALRELEGPFYIHCHHGKHRAPAAASVACVSAGLIAPDAVPALLKLAGTSRAYRGLYASAESARPVDSALLDAIRVEFHEAVPAPPMTEAMVAVGHTHDHLVTLAAAGWTTPHSHPDLDAAHEALLLREHFTELLRSDHALQESPVFRRLLEDSESAAMELERALLLTDPSRSTADSKRRISRTFGRVSRNCRTCHRQFRDVPLDESTADGDGQR